MVQVDVDGAQVALCLPRLFAARIVGNDPFVGCDGFGVFVVLVVEQADFSGSLAGNGAFGEFAHQFGKRGDGLRVVLKLDVGAPAFVECVVGILRVGIFAEEFVEVGHLACVVFLQASHESLLVERIVGGCVVHGGGFGIAVLCGGKLTVVGVGQDGLWRALRVSAHIAGKPRPGVAIVFLFEIGISQVVEGQGIGRVAFRFGLREVACEVGGSLRVASQAVVGFASPVVGIGLRGKVVSA